MSYPWLSHGYLHTAPHQLVALALDVHAETNVPRFRLVMIDPVAHQGKKTVSGPDCETLEDKTAKWLRRVATPEVQAPDWFTDWLEDYWDCIHWLEDLEDHAAQEGVTP